MKQAVPVVALTAQATLALAQRFSQSDRPEVVIPLPPEPEPFPARTTSWARLITATIARTILATVIGMLFWTVAPVALGWNPTTVMTGSMEPRISPGDVVVARPVDPATLMPEQILLVSDPDHAGRLRLHRLVRSEPDGGLRLKGDANAAEDSTPVTRDAVRGVAVLRVPLIGSPVVWFAEGDWLALGAVMAGVLGLVLLVRVDRSRPDRAEPPAPVDRPGPRVLGNTALPRVATLGAALVLLASIVVVARPAGAGWATSVQNPTSTAASAALFTCAGAVAANTPSQSYRLGEAVGTSAADSSGNNRTATYQGGSAITYGQVGPCPRDAGTAVTLNGAAGYVSTANQVTNPTTYSTEIWFRTTTTRGGLLTGFGNTATGSSGTYDRVVYMLNNGRLTFAAGTNLTNAISSTVASNDGLWHHVVATQSSAGMRLYVDGAQVATSAATAARSYTGYWRVGYNNLAVAPNVPTSYYFAGTIANAAFSSTTALTAAQVAAHYAAAAPFTSCREAVQAADPVEFYRLSEPAGTLVQDWSGTDRPGTYQGTVTRGVTGPCGSTTGVTLDGVTGYISTDAFFTSPTTYSIESWFRTSGTRGGLIGGFSGSATGAAATYDRMVYLTDSGQLIFGTYPGSFQVVRSATGLNNGAWHLVVATQSSAGMRLYVDGVLVGTNATTGSQGFDGYWRFGYNNLDSWESSPADDHFAGSLINAAVYPTALTATQVAAHWTARTASGN